MAETRIERDSLGEIAVPADALWGAQTQRAIQNFRISGRPMPRPFIRALGLVKAAAATVNARLGLLEADLAEAIQAAADEVAEGRWDDHFPVDVFQTGSGTSTNMNANEVIAARARQVLDRDDGPHPNDHVNMGQSSNDVIPTALHVAAYLRTDEILKPGLGGLAERCEQRARELSHVVKTGRTHLMDAMPVRFGAVLEGWAHQVALGLERVEAALFRLAMLPLGGTAVGTGLNTHPEFGRLVAEALAGRTGLPLRESDQHMMAQAALDVPADLSAALKTTASGLMKIADDLRWMNSGPVAGLGEIRLPTLQPGSSIMPGKVNPIACEATMMACAQVIANDLAVTLGNERGNFELNVMQPLIARNLLESIELLGNAARTLAESAVAGFEVNSDRLEALLGRNPILVTALNPLIGYEKGAQIVKRAYAEGRSLREIAAEETDLSAEQLDRLLNPRRLADGGCPWDRAQSPEPQS